MLISLWKLQKIGMTDIGKVRAAATQRDTHVPSPWVPATQLQPTVCMQKIQSQEG